MQPDTLLIAHCGASVAILFVAYARSFKSSNKTNPLVRIRLSLKTLVGGISLVAPLNGAEPSLLTVGLLVSMLVSDLLASWTWHLDDTSEGAPCKTGS